MAPPDQNNIKDTSPANTLTFSGLPIELRREIWELVAFQPRNVDIWTLDVDTVTTNLRYIYRHVSRQPPPAILHTNRESRAIGLQYYELSFGRERVVELGIKVTTPARIYVNFEVDTMVAMSLEQPSMSLWVNEYVLSEKMKFLAFDLHYKMERINETALLWMVSVMEMICSLDWPALERITFYYQRKIFTREDLKSFRGQKLDITFEKYTEVEMKEKEEVAKKQLLEDGRGAVETFFDHFRGYLNTYNEKADRMGDEVKRKQLVLRRMLVNGERKDVFENENVGSPE